MQAPLLRGFAFTRCGTRLLNTQIDNGPKKLVLTSFGDPVKCLSLEKDSPSVLDPPTGDEVVVKVLASPINPADINTAQGVYPVKPSLPGVIGHEGVMQVIFSLVCSHFTISSGQFAVTLVYYVLVDYQW